MATLIETKKQEKSLSNFGRFWQRFRKQRLAILSAIFLLFMVFVAIFRDQLMPFTKDSADFFSTYCQPSFMSNEDVVTCLNPEEHLFGTDDLGRDAYSRLIYGARISMQASLLGVAIAIVLGLPIGMLSGFIGGRFDRAVMWVVDVIFSLPGILIAFGVIAVLGNGLLNAMIAVGVVLSTRFARLSRGVVLAEREELYVDGARVGGLSTLSIVFKHILPNIAPPLIVQTSLLFGAVILIEAGLSFLGVGVPVSEPSWGRMLAESRSVLISNPFLSVPPGLAIAITVLAWNILGDGLRDALGRDISNNQLTTSAKLQNKKSSSGKSHISKESATNAALMLSNIEVRFPTPRGVDVEILRDVSYSVAPGETLGIVGESGSGKSMSVMAAMGIVPSPGQISAGNVFVTKQNITEMSESELRQLRGKEIAMIFQEPIASLNPALTVGQQLIQPMQVHLGMSKSEAWAEATTLLRKVRIPEPERRMDEYPHQFSGGMAQRVGIARALSCNPKVLIADEPTTALDVTVQGQIIDLLKDLQRDLGLAIVFITHDLGVIAEVADRIAVMYAGEVVETGDVRVVLTNPRHPYTKALLETLPHHGKPGERLPVIEGLVPPPTDWPTGCRFHPRCAYATAVCSNGADFEMRPVRDKTTPSQEHFSRCIRVDEINFS
ncbi:MAG: dipeptide/oligopeptide/nickel ABC transporter permease/ATP-binding protein [Anaerolineae bacterium]